ncbi:ATP-binding protein [Crossiella sp. CA198]|uniref:ATP-binding protein n=1 Tax=Crossiella sp. CA198 TaxID=3455607 RepID=UPI003F8D6426
MGSNEVSGRVGGHVVQAGTINQVVLGPAAELPVPRQLPPSVRDFTGRTGPLATLDALLSGPAAATVIAVLDGTAGVGKTTLAVHWAHRVQPQFPDGTLFANLRGHGPSSPLDPRQVLGWFLGALGLPEARIPAELDTQTALYRSLLAGRRVLLVLDNAAGADQVRPLLPGAPGCLVLVTSRAGLSDLVIGEAAVPVTLDLPSTAEATELAGRLLGPVAPQGIADLVRVCARLPLALRVAAGRVRRRGDLDTAIEEIRRDQQSGVRTVFDWSYRQLTAEQAHLFRRLGLHPGPEISVPAAATLATLDLATAHRLLDELAEVHLVEPLGPKRYHLHDLLRAYAAEVAEAEDPVTDREQAVRALLEWYAQVSATADQLLFPGFPFLPKDFPAAEMPLTDPAQALAWCTTERANLFAALQLAAELGEHRLTTYLASTSRFRLRLPRDVLPEHVEALSLGIRADPDSAAEALLRLWRAATCRMLSRWPAAQADLDRLLELAEQLGSARWRASALCELGLGCLEQHRFAAAREHYTAALPLARTTGNLRQEAVAEGNLSTICTRLGEYEEALGHAERELDLRRAAGDRSGQAWAWLDAALAWQGLGEHDTAIRLCQEAIQGYRDLGRGGEPLARCLETLAVSLAHTGDPAQAARCRDEAAAIRDELGL